MQKFLIFLVLFFISSPDAYSQKIKIASLKETSTQDSLISFYVKKEEYTFEKKITAYNQDSLYLFDCYSGKSVLIVSVFNKEPINAEGFLYIYQKTTTKTTRQRFSFESTFFNQQLQIYTSSIKIFFPQEANTKNCFAKVTMRDKEKEANNLYFLIFTK